MSALNRFRCRVFLVLPGHLTESEIELEGVYEVRVGEGGDLQAVALGSDGEVERAWQFAAGVWRHTAIVDVGAQTRGTRL